MKKISVLLCALAIFAAPSLSGMAYSQSDIYSAAGKSLDWIEKNASPLRTPDSAASDYSIMALSEMNRDFDYGKYLSYTQSRNPSTDKDGQRLIMAETACGSVVSDSFVRMYTYNKMRDNASDLSGAIITLDSGGYDVKSDGFSMDHMVMMLLSMQQYDGSFGGDVYTTARSLLALSAHRGSRYDVSGTNDNESYSYSTESAIESAAAYLANSMRGDFGYGTFTNTAFVVMALDSVGINAETDQRFSSGGSSPVSWIISQQAADGGFNSSADDTALAACALVSHLRALQGKSGFFDFRAGDAVNSISSSDTQSASGAAADGSSAQKKAASPPAETAAPKKTQSPVVKLTPGPTKQPEHSEMDEEEYGPIAPMGPVKPDATDSPAIETKTTGADADRSQSAAAAFIIIAAILAAAGGALLFIHSKYPELLERFIPALYKGDGKTGNDMPKAPAQAEENDILSEIDSTEPAVSTEELYDPDFVKKLIPVEQLDESIGSIVSDAEAPVQDNG